MNLHVPSTQSGRMVAVNTRLGPDVLPLDGLDVDEIVNGLFTLEVTARRRRRVGHLPGAGGAALGGDEVG